MCPGLSDPYLARAQCTASANLLFEKLKNHLISHISSHHVIELPYNAYDLGVSSNEKTTP